MSFQVEFVSPEEILYSGVASMVVARTRGGGDIAFMTGHEPLIGSLLPSEVRVTEDDDNILRFAIRGGFVSVSGDKVTVLSDEAIRVADIDSAAAQEAIDKANSELASAPDNELAASELAWAELQLAVAADVVSSH